MSTTGGINSVKVQDFESAVSSYSYMCCYMHFSFFSKLKQKHDKVLIAKHRLPVRHKKQNKIKNNYKNTKYNKKILNE